MTVEMNHQFDDASIDHIGFSVSDLIREADRFVEAYGFTRYGQSSDAVRGGSAIRSVALQTGDIRLLLTEARDSDHPAAAYVERHDSGVTDIALRVRDVPAAYAAAVRRGARPVAPPAATGGVVTASFVAFGDVVHTLVQRRPGVNERALPGLHPVPEPDPAGDVSLLAVDHLAVCLEAGQLDSAVDFYEQALGFQTIFEERIVVGVQAMNSKVVQSRSGQVTFTLIEPDVSRTPGQIDEFLKGHGGAGVQHIAFVVDDIVRSVDDAQARGVEFLHTPPSYYGLLRERLDVDRHRIEDLQTRSILVDQDHDGQLFQIFTRSTHPRRTLFFEIIERRGARAFGTNNIKALYEAVEVQRLADAARS